MGQRKTKSRKNIKLKSQGGVRFTLEGKPSRGLLSAGLRHDTSTPGTVLNLEQLRCTRNILVFVFFNQIKSGIESPFDQAGNMLPPYPMRDILGARGWLSR